MTDEEKKEKREKTIKRKQLPPTLPKDKVQVQLKFILNNILLFERELALLVALQVLSSKGVEGGRMREDEGELSDKILLGQE